MATIIDNSTEKMLTRTLIAGVDSGEYYIMEVIDEDGEEQLAEVEDDALLDELSAIFEKHFEELFDEADEEE